MKNFDSLPEESQCRFDQASDWQLRLASEPSLEASSEFQAWLSDSENRRAFQGVTAAWTAAQEFAVEPAILDMRQAALRRVRAASTVRWRSKPLVARIAATLIGIAVLGGGAGYYYFTAPTVYATATGERRTIGLSDGSRVALDSDTKISVRFTGTARELNLDHGRAHFDVAHDIARPFSVHVGGETVVAVGTSFDVEKIGSKVMVTLMQGKVVVKGDPSAAIPIITSAPKAHPAISLEAGQEFVASNDIQPAVKPTNVTIASAWESGRLVFNGDTLAEAVARVNRYTDRPIQVDPAVSSIRIIGSFSAGDVSTFVSAVTSYFPVQASTTADNTILLQPRT